MTVGASLPWVRKGAAGFIPARGWSYLRKGPFCQGATPNRGAAASGLKRQDWMHPWQISSQLWHRGSVSSPHLESVGTEMPQSYVPGWGPQPGEGGRKGKVTLTAHETLKFL